MNADRLQRAHHGPLIEPDSLCRIITEGEALGLRLYHVSDHIMVPRNLGSKYPYTDTGEFPAGTAAAWLEQLDHHGVHRRADHEACALCMSVMVVPHRPAVLTAKMLATIDYLSKGRLTLGIGVGWCREEFEAIGAAPFDDRGHVTDEWMMACKELWSHDDPRFDGKYVKFSDVVFTPKPVQQPIPIWVGGESGAGAATHGALRGWLVSGRHQPAIPDEHARSVQGGPGAVPWLRREGGGRDPARSRWRCVCSWDLAARPRRTIDGEAEMFTGGAAEYVADIKALAELGVSAVDVRLFAPTLDATIDNMRRFRDEVMAKVR